MVLGKKYFEMRQLLLENGFLKISIEPEYIGYFEDEIPIILSKFEIKSKYIPFDGLNKLQNNCILSLIRSEPDNRGYPLWKHSVVYDTKNKKILDPANQINNLEKWRINVEYCLEIA